MTNQNDLIDRRKLLEAISASLVSRAKMAGVDRAIDIINAQERVDAEASRGAKPTTNADHIRHMTDEELGAFLDGVTGCCAGDINTTPCTLCPMCVMDGDAGGCDIEAWLKMPYEEETDCPWTSCKRPGRRWRNPNGMINYPKGGRKPD